MEQLRQWAAKFGENGSERGKKGGYGARFGFGDKVREEDKEKYGRVRPEDDE